MTTPTRQEAHGRSTPSAAPETDLAFYTVTDASYFAGTAILLDSLRRAGEEAPLIVVDCGMTAGQRERLARHATLVPSTGDNHPLLQKALGLQTRPAKVMVFIDSDVIVARSLAPLVEAARAGRVVVFEDFGDPTRFFAEWSTPELGELRRQPYANSGFIALDWVTAQELLPLFDSMRKRVDIASTFVGDGSPANPFFFADQDILNAILCSSFDGRVTWIDRTLAPFPPFVGIEATNDSVKLCAFKDGTQPFLLHHIGRKPWRAALRPNCYSTVFTRLVSESDAHMTLHPREVPLRLTGRQLASLDRWRAARQHDAHERLRGKLGLRPHLDKWMQSLKRPQVE